MTTIQIKHCYSARVLYECEAPEGLESGLHMRHALEQAAAAKKDLRGANLLWIDLRGANMGWATLSGKNVLGERPVNEVQP